VSTPPLSRALDSLKPLKNFSPGGP
jgi:hypothetical protein